MIKPENLVILKQPSHTILSIVVINNKFPLTEQVHKELDSLNEVSDVILIFDKNSYKTEIDRDAFSKLYDVCAWVESSGNISKTMLKIFLYDREVFKRHTNTFITSQERLDHMEINFDNFLKTIMMDNIKPIIGIRRLTTFELFSNYQRKTVHFGTLGKLEWLISTHIPKLAKYLIAKNNGYFRFSTTENLLVLLKPHVIDPILDVINDEYVNLFENYSPFEFLASAIKYLSIENLDPNSLSYEVYSTREK